MVRLGWIRIAKDIRELLSETSLVFSVSVSQYGLEKVSSYSVQAVFSWYEGVTVVALVAVATPS